MDSAPARPSSTRIHQSDGDQFGRCGQQGRSVGTVEARRATRSQQLQNIAVLLPNGGHHAEHPLDESAARLVVGPTAALAPKHRLTKHSPSISRMTFAPRVPAIVNTAATCVTATQSHALLRFSRQEVSSAPASWLRTYSRSSSTGACRLHQRRHGLHSIRSGPNGRRLRSSGILGVRPALSRLGARRRAAYYRDRPKAGKTVGIARKGSTINICRNQNATLAAVWRHVAKKPKIPKRSKHLIIETDRCMLALGLDNTASFDENTGMHAP